MQYLAQEKQVKNWMTAHYEDYIDPLTGELGITKMAEDALTEFDIDPDGDLGDYVFDWAVEVEAELVDQDLVQKVP